MKTLHVTFTDSEYRRLIKSKCKKKGSVSWHSFILVSCCEGVRIK